MPAMRWVTGPSGVEKSTTEPTAMPGPSGATSTTSPGEIAGSIDPEVTTTERHPGTRPGRTAAPTSQAATPSTKRLRIPRLAAERRSEEDVDMADGRAVVSTG